MSQLTNGQLCSGRVRYTIPAPLCTAACSGTQRQRVWPPTNSDFFNFFYKVWGESVCQCLHKCSEMVDTSLSGHVEQGRRAKVVPCGMTPKQNNWASRPAGKCWQILKATQWFWFRKGASEWWIWIWTFPFFPIHLPLKLKNENEQPGKSFLQLSGDCATESDSSNLTFPSHKASVYWHKFIVSSLLRIY